MRIIVILGRVLDPRGIVVNPRAGRIFINREEYRLQPADRCALELALRIKEATGAEVVALPRTFLPDDDVLRQALATGADRAVYIAGQPTALPDDGLMARVLVAAVEKLGGADLILTGATTLDTGQGQLGPRLAEALGWPQILSAWTAEVADGAVRAVRQDGAGYVKVEAPLPAVVTVVPGALKPRYPNGRRLINIYKGMGEIAAALERWEATDLVAPEALVPMLERRGQDFPPERERGTRLSGTLEEVARAAAEALRARLSR
jgi:electron transfer flavoprotein beta subunit